MVEDGKVADRRRVHRPHDAGRRWSDGLHQAVEAKENVAHRGREPDAGDDHLPELLPHVQQARRHDRHRRHRGRRVLQDLQARRGRRSRPTSRSCARTTTTSIYKNEREQVPRGASTRSSECHEQRPAGAGRHVSVEKSESSRACCCSKNGIPHKVLNAKHHEREAEIVAQAGRKGAVTIATNMAGRGTDIILGGNPEMHGARRGRAARRSGGRSGDVDESTPRVKEAIAEYKAQCDAEKKRCSPPAACTSSAPSATSPAASTTSCAAAPAARAIRASSRFYLSLEDDLMRIFAGERITGLMERLGMEEDVPIEHRWSTARSRTRRRKVEEPQLRHPQEPARVRRRDEPAAQDDLRAAPPGARGALPARAVRGGKEEGQGAAAPTESGEWTIESLAEQIQPRAWRRSSTPHGRRAQGRARSTPNAIGDAARDAPTLRADDGQLLDREELTHEL